MADERPTIDPAQVQAALAALGQDVSAEDATLLARLLAGYRAAGATLRVPGLAALEPAVGFRFDPPAAQAEVAP